MKEELLDIYFQNTEEENNKKEIIAKYKTEERDGVHIKTITIPVRLFNYPSNINNPSFFDEPCFASINLGFGTINTRRHIITEDELIEPKIEKMTVSDIEAILGYKVEIIAEKE